MSTVTIVSVIVAISISAILGISVIVFSVSRLIENRAKLSFMELLVVSLMMAGSIIAIIVDVVLAMNIISILMRR